MTIFYNFIHAPNFAELRKLILYLLCCVVNISTITISENHYSPTQGKHTMLKLIKSLARLLTTTGSISTGLDDYINSKRPTSVAEIENLTRQYLARGVCGRII